MPLNNAQNFLRIPFACPLDGLPLGASGQALCCANGHGFDRSKFGHANLLPVQFKASKDPGDSKSMVAARRRVMDAGLFEPLSDAIAQHVRDHAVRRDDADFLLVDAGCGEGFYTERMARGLGAAMHAAEPLVLGVDISKWAVIAAARRYAGLAWAVASSRQLPLIPGSVDMISCIFGFQSWDAWAKLQQLGQKVLIVDAGPAHLLELRALIYEEVRVHEAPHHDAALRAGYSRISETSCAYKTIASNRDIVQDILEMTPHGHRISQTRRDAVETTCRLDLTIDAVIRVYQRNEMMRI